MSDPINQLDSASNRFSSSIETTWRWVSRLEEPTLVSIGLGVTTVLVLISLRFALRFAASKIPENQADGHSWSAILQRIVSRFRMYFFMAIGFVIATHAAQAPEPVVNFSETLLLIASVFQLARIFQAAAISVLRRNAYRGKKDQSSLADALGVLKWFVNVSIWSIATLMVLSNLGFNVTGLVAGLGIGGIAIGLAAQDLFKDLFAALAILFDQPFKRGDFISSGDRILGTVEDVGMKTTRIRALSGEQIILTNSNLLALTLQNYGRMSRRRVVVQTGITYQTPADMVKRAAEIQKEAVLTQKAATFDRAHFMAYGASSLDYELVFFIESPDYNTFMDIQQEILLEIYRRYEEEGLEFAYPTRTLHVTAPNGEAIDTGAPARRSKTQAD